MNYRERAIILNQKKINDADKLLILFGEKKGKFTVIAKGAQKPTTKKTSNIELGGEIKGFFAKSRSLDLLLEAKLVNSINILRNSLLKSALLFYLLELFDKFFIEGIFEKQDFLFIKECIDNLTELDEKDLSDLRFLYAIEIKLLDKEGVLSLENIDKKNYKILKFVQQFTVLDIYKLKLTKKDLHNLDELIHRQIDLFLDKKIKSRKYLYKILNLHNG